MKQTKKPRGRPPGSKNKLIANIPLIETSPQPSTPNPFVALIKITNELNAMRLAAFCFENRIEFDFCDW